MQDITALAEQEVRREIEGLSREEKIVKLREIAGQQVEEPGSLEDMVRKAKAEAARKLLQELEPHGDCSAVLREINEKLDRVLELLTQATPAQESREENEAPAAEETGAEETKEEQELSDLAKEVLNFLRERQGAGFREIVNYLGKSREEVMKAISELFDNQLIRKEGYVYVAKV